MHRKNRFCFTGDGRFQPIGIEVIGRWVDIDKHRMCATVANSIGSGDKGVTDGDYFIGRTNAQCKEGKM